jgi:hypothetical protein
MSGLWDKVNPEAAAEAARTSQAVAQPAVANKPSRWGAWKWRAVNVTASLVWLYAICKAFVFDVDLYIFQRVWPAGGWLVTYRFFVLIVIASLLALVLRKPAFFAWLFYFSFFPVILVIWWFPRFIYKQQSWVVLLAVMNAMTSLVRDFRYTLATKSCALIAIALIVVNPLSQLTLLAGVVLLVLLMVTYVRTLSIVLRPSRFVAGQQTAIDKFVSWSAITQLWALSEDLKNPQIVRFDSGQMSKFMAAVSWGATVHRILYFWAFQLETYRKGAAPYLFSLLSYLWLVVQTIVAFAFINFALYRSDASAFSAKTTPQLFDFFHYSISLVLGGSVDYLSAHSQVAIALGDLVKLTGPVILVTIFATMILSLRQTRQDDQMKDSIARIKARGRQFDAEFQAQYEVSIEEAVERLRELPGTLLGVVAWFSRHIPADFEERKG